MNKNKLVNPWNANKDNVSLLYLSYNHALYNYTILLYILQFLFKHLPAPVSSDMEELQVFLQQPESSWFNPPVSRLISGPVVLHVPSCFTLHINSVDLTT